MKRKDDAVSGSSAKKMKLLDYCKTNHFRVNGLMRGHNIKNNGKGNKYKGRKREDTR